MWRLIRFTLEAVFTAAAGWLANVIFPEAPLWVPVSIMVACLFVLIVGELWHKEIGAWLKKVTPVVLEGQPLGIDFGLSRATLEVTPPSRWFRIRRFIIEAIKYVCLGSPESRFAALHDEIAEELERTASYRGFPMFAEEGPRWAKRETLAIKLIDLGINVPDSRDDEAWMDILPPLVAFSANRKLSDAHNLCGSEG